MKVTGIHKQRIEVEITERQLAYLLFPLIFKKIGGPVDDAGCDWLTKDGNTYISNSEWHISSDPDVATLVDAVNIISLGEPLHLDE